MKILIQNSVFHPNIIGGAEMSSFLLAQQIHARGHEADALATTGRREGARELTTRPLEGTPGTIYEGPPNGFYDIFGPDGPPPPPGILVRGLHHFAAVHSPAWKKLAGQALDRSQPDILHTNTLVGMTPVVWQAARDRGIPIVHTLRDYHLLCPRTTLLRSNGSECIKPPLPCQVLKKLKLDRTGGIAVVTAPSQFVLDRHMAAGGFPGARPVRVPNACETLPEPFEPPAGTPRGIFLGQLDAHKGVGLILEAIETLLAGDAPAFGFDFAGVGPMAPEVQALCERDPDRFRYHGLVKGDQKAALLRGASFLLVPSVWNDNFPRTMLDAFSHGLPVIGARRGGIPEVVGHEQEGIIIDPDAGQLAAAMTRYLLDGALRRRHGDAAKQAAQLYTLDKQVDAFMGIYEDLLSD